MDSQIDPRHGAWSSAAQYRKIGSEKWILSPGGVRCDCSFIQGQGDGTFG